MDVRITYAVDLDKVPEKVADMLSELEISKAVRMARLATEMIDLGNHKMGIVLIEKARQSLSAADRCLSDAQMILGGYADAKTPTEPPDAPVKGQPEPPDAPVKTTGEGDVD